MRLPVSLYASAVKAAEMHGLSVGQYVEMSLEAQLVKDRAAYKVLRFEHAQKQALAARKPSPMPQDYGLAADYGIPPHP